MKRREKGRCFHYGGAYSYGHKCHDKNLRVMTCGEGDEELEEDARQKNGMEEDTEDWDYENRDNKECYHMNLLVLSTRV